MRLLIISVGLWIFGARLIAAGDVTFSSGPAQAALIELFTSEGCSSCPPAEQWLASLRREPGLWTQFVPVAFHVDYWDRLGWRDRLASKEFTARQQAYISEWRSSGAYTPCFVRNGREWSTRNDPAQAGESNAGKLSLEWDGAGACAVTYSPPVGITTGALDVSVALLGGGVETKVTRGENAGRQLEHEFVTLRLKAQRLQRGNTGTYSATVTGLTRPDIPAKRHALAAWITPSGKSTPLQSAGGWLPGESSQ